MGRRKRGPWDPAPIHKRVSELMEEGRVSHMDSFVQHGRVSTLEHAIRVAHMSARLAHVLRLRVREDELVRGAMLHDYYLYDWHDPANKGHATQHPLRALRCAERDFRLTDKERNIIAAHMWPLPPTRVPRSREAWLVCVADKLCSLEETLFMRH